MARATAHPADVLLLVHASAMSVSQGGRANRRSSRAPISRRDRCQQAARRLTGPLIDGRVRLVRRFAEFTGAWPWRWTPSQVEEWEAWVASGGWAHSTVRSYDGALAVFLGYVCDPRYGWIAECEQQVGARPVQVCHEGNTAVHAAGYEGRPERRPLTRAELQAFLAAADDHVERAGSSRRKGWLAAFRDATLFKVVYG